MNCPKYFLLILGLSAPLLILIGKANPARNGAGKISVARQATPSRPAEIPARAMPVLSASLGRDDSRYQFRPAKHGFLAKNSRNNFAAEFTTSGVTIGSGEARVGLKLSGYGYREHLQSFSPAAPYSTANRIEYRRGKLIEWYVNGPLGLEQGFTLDVPPQKPTGQPLQIVMAISSGNMSASRDEGGRSVSFARRDGKPVLRYAGLLAQDATGRELPAWMELQGNRLILAIKDSGARYPITVDPTFSLTAILTAILPAGTTGILGTGVAIDDTNDAIVATAEIDSPISQASSFAWVFVKKGSSWAAATQLTNSDSGAVSASISGDGSTIVVGSCENAVCKGHAFVYVEPSGGWSSTAMMTPTATLSASNASTTGGDRIGISVSTDHSGDAVAVGAPCELTVNHTGSLLCGSVYVFVKPPSGWASMASKSQDVILTVPATPIPGSNNETLDDTLGVSVSMDSTGGTIVAGATGIFSSNNTPGAAYVFLKPSLGWPCAMPPCAITAANATLTASDKNNGDELGRSVSISGDGKTVVAGAPLNLATGAAYVFVKPSLGWATNTQNAKLTAKDPSPAVNGVGDGLGQASSISSDGSTVVVGAPSHPVSPCSPTPCSPAGPGAAYVFLKPSGGWANQTQPATLKATAGADINGNSVMPATVGFTGTGFGAGGGSLFISSCAATIVAGGPGAKVTTTVGSTPPAGAAYVFKSQTTAGDFDGDGRADAAVWRPSNGTWYIIPSRIFSSFRVQQWGTVGDIPVRGDFDCDGLTDIAVWRPSNGTWYIIPSSNPSAPIVQQWGTQGDIPVPGDYDGDGKTDFAVFRPSTGTWFIIPSSNPSAPIAKQWGTQGDIPVPGDYDGDGKTDFAVFRPSTGTWFIIPSSNPSAPIVKQWGTQGDIRCQAISMVTEIRILQFSVPQTGCGTSSPVATQTFQSSSNGAPSEIFQCP